ncbi:membrane protein insertase YidC [Flavobacteriaceae bacterium]|nr:membrane protein insertase YidC [Flavobacteriaceae bacterium]
MLLVKFLNRALDFFYSLTDSFGLSIILLSLMVTIIMLPLFWISEIIQQKERTRKKLMQPSLNEIKGIKNRKERYFYKKEIYKKNQYNPFYSLIGFLGLLIQVPFFLAAYWMILEYDALQGVSFGLIKDLSQPDRLFLLKGKAYNLLPFLMTSVNLYAVYLHSKSSEKFERIQLTIIAFIFLVFLYDLSAALVLYWTMNNLFSIGKNRLFKAKNLIKWSAKFNFKWKIKTIIQSTFNQLGKKSHHIMALNLIIIINIIIILLLPIQLITFYDDQFVLDISTSLEIILIALTFSTVITILLYLFVSYLFNKYLLDKSKIKFSQVASASLLFILSWITLSGYIFPLIKSTGGLISENHSTLPLDWINLVIVFIGSILITRLFYSNHGYKIILIFFSIFYVSVLPSNIIEIKNINEKWENLRLKLARKNIDKFSSNKNLLVLSFDGLQRNVVEDVFENEQEIFSEFNDFLFFNNVISTEPATVLSMVNELFGNNNYGEIANNQDSLLNKLPMNTLLLNQKFSKEVNVSVYGPYNMFNSKSDNEHFIDSERHTWAKFIQTYYYVCDRLLSGKYTESIVARLRAYIFDPVVSILYFGDDISLNGFNNFKQAEIKEYTRWVDDIHIVEKDTLTIKYLHFNHTHFPITFDRNGKDQLTNKSWIAKNQNYLGTYNQTYFALKQFITLINKLKELKVYDNTFLVLKSDHGKPTTYFEDFPNNLRINNHKLWGYSRYAGPLLMIKDINRKDTVLTKIQELVTLGDLATTISLKFHQYTIPPGLNLLNKINKTKSPNIYLNIVKDSNSNFKFDTHKTIKLDRSIDNSLIDLLNFENVKLSNDSIKLYSKFN